MRCQIEQLRALIRPHACREPKGSVVGLLNHLRDRTKALHGKHGAKDLFLYDLIRLGDIRKDRGFAPKALLGQSAIALIDLGALGKADLDVVLDRIELLSGIDGSDIRILVQGIADIQDGHSILEFL